ncbi:MAG TPA: hypothetical protein VGP93_05490 [Polyangiaceae bacterium]|nr:hypothetical protein [Polyangiaceae bacterium]
MTRTPDELFEFDLNGFIVYRGALIHGTSTWRAKHQHRSLLYKYSPGYSAWGEAEHLGHLVAQARTEMQQALLRPPSVGSRSALPFGG